MTQNLDQKIEQLQAENLQLQRAVQELAIINEIATAINSTMTIEQIVQLMVQKCVKHMNVEQASVMLLEDTDISKAFHTMVRQSDSRSEVLPYRLNNQLTGWMLKNKTPLVVNDLMSDPRFVKDESVQLTISSLLSVPLISKGEMIGIITVFNKKSGEFDNNDKRLLSIIATQSAQVIENARLLEEEQQLFVFQEELRTAAEIQNKLLPQEPPLIECFDIAGKSIPAKTVGGDYFDFMKTDYQQLMFCLADVTGKGLPAALLMANTQATIRGQAINTSSPAKSVANANRLIHHNTGMGKFVTLFYGLLDCHKFQIKYCNAGHDHPMLFRNGKLHDRLTTGGLVLGFLPEYDYQEDAIFLEPGDVLVIYSDGVTEAMNENDEEFGEDRIQEIVENNYRLSAKEMVEHIISAVRDHAGRVSQSDDITLMVIRRN
jgi:sigma-B regulation protein RsbU (phosphoserine phosphatase)